MVVPEQGEFFAQVTLLPCHLPHPPRGETADAHLDDVGVVQWSDRRLYPGTAKGHRRVDPVRVTVLIGVGPNRWCGIVREREQFIHHDR